VLRHGIGKLFGQSVIPGCEVQKGQNRPAEIFDEFGLLPVPLSFKSLAVESEEVDSHLARVIWGRGDI